MKKFLAAATALFLAGQAHAGTFTNSEIGKHKYVAVSLGANDLLFDNTEAESATFGLEYRHTTIWNNLAPVAGGFITSEGSAYGYVGLLYYIEPIKNFVITPYTSLGLYKPADTDEDLGGPIEFQSGIEFGYNFDECGVASIGINHISNASIYDRNEGTEILYLKHAFPF